MLEFNTITGVQTGTTLTLTGSASGTPLLSADGTRALITTYVRDANNIDTTQVAVIDTSTGTQVFAPLTLPGQPAPSASMLLSPNGSRALIVTEVYDGRTSTSTTQVRVIDTTTGTQTGNTVTLTGYQASGPPLVSADGTHAVISATSDDSVTGTSTTRVAVIETTTGMQVGTTLALTGYGYSLLSANGTRALITTDGPTGAQVAVINIATGTQAGTTLTLTGGLRGFPWLSADGTRALITTTPTSSTTRVSVLQIA
jgi:hypothetical protein